MKLRWLGVSDKGN